MTAASLSTVTVIRNNKKISKYKNQNEDTKCNRMIVQWSTITDRIRRTTVNMFISSISVIIVARIIISINTSKYHVNGTINKVPTYGDYLNMMITPTLASTALIDDNIMNPIARNLQTSVVSVGELVEETGFYQSIRLTDEEPLLRKQSLYQLIEVRRSPYYGKVLILDGVMQLTERDADSYNEMMAHVAMFTHTTPKRVLIIGGGDGYVLHEVLKHPSVQHVDHVDLDGDVLEVSKEFFPWGKHSWDDPRVTVHIADGSKFVKEYNEQLQQKGTNTNTSVIEPYDVIIQDSSDPWTTDPSGRRVLLPSSVLYSTEHIENVYNILSDSGVFVMQAEAIQIPSDLTGIREWRQLALNVGFETSRYGTITISSYPTGQIGFLLSEKGTYEHRATMDDVETRYNTYINSIPKQRTSYYHPPLQTNTFVLPKWAHDHIYNEYVESSPSCLSEESK